jgi:hypothetical protein
VYLHIINFAVQSEVEANGGVTFFLVLEGIGMDELRIPLGKAPPRRLLGLVVLRQGEIIGAEIARNLVRESGH